MRDANGICKRNKLGKRFHAERIAKDGEGRRFLACVECGAMFVFTGRIEVSETVLERNRNQDLNYRVF